MKTAMLNLFYYITLQVMQLDNLNFHVSVEWADKCIAISENLTLYFYVSAYKCRYCTYTSHLHCMFANNKK